MQGKKFDLRSCRIGCLPIIDLFILQMNIEAHLKNALGNTGYADAIVILIKNILIDRNALYAIREWASQFGLRLSDGREIGDDRLGRALDRLFETDRATLQTKIVLTVIKAFKIKMDQIHNDTTSITVSGRYDNQDEKGVQLKRGHSKDHRPDLKQLIYSLCVSRDGAVPVHFKSFDGNRTDDTIHWEIWNDLRTLLQTPNFKYVGDSKLCVSQTLRKIDSAHGQFVAMVPRTRGEVEDFTNALAQGDVRWQRILRKQSNRNRKEFDTFDSALGPYYLEEGFYLFWYRSSQKKRRDIEGRKDRINRAFDRLENMDLRRLRGPKTEKAIRSRIDAILRKYKVQDLLEVDIKMDAEEEFKATTRGKPTSETHYRRIVKSLPRLHIKRNAEAIARSQLMDGIFPLTTNTKDGALATLKIYKYQPNIEKRHARLKSTLDVAPVWLKKNTRIEALMFVEYLAQMTTALIERQLRQQMQVNNIKLLTSLPEGRASQTPTFEQLLRLFEGSQRHELFDKQRMVESYAVELMPVQSQILSLLRVPESRYACPK